jgi:hypothetical protein
MMELLIFSFIPHMILKLQNHKNVLDNKKGAKRFFLQMKLLFQRCKKKCWWKKVSADKRMSINRVYELI